MKPQVASVTIAPGVPIVELGRIGRLIVDVRSRSCRSGRNGTRDLTVPARPERSVADRPYGADRAAVPIAALVLTAAARPDRAARPEWKAEERTGRSAPDRDGGSRARRDDGPRHSSAGPRSTSATAFDFRSAFAASPRSTTGPRSGSGPRPDRPLPVRVVVPELPPGVSPDQLDPAVKRELRSLAKATAETVAGQLVAAGTFWRPIPQAALAHARAARRIASRVASVREAAGLAAYAAGEYAEALSELRAHRRMTGLAHQIPVMADCERALGRPAKALELLNDAPVAELPPAARAELLLVRSGAHRDLGQAREALAALEVGELDSPAIKPWTVRLWYGYGEALLGVGRHDEAREWFAAVAAVDDGETDAAERLEADGARHRE